MDIIDARRRDRRTIPKATILAIAISLCSGCGGGSSGIDIFSPQGATDLEKAYALPAGSVIVKSDE